LFFKRNVHFYLLLIFLLSVFNTVINAQNLTDEIILDSDIKKSSFNWENLPYYMDDIWLLGGVNSSGLHWSNNFRELDYAQGFHLGIETYIPMERILFLSIGVHYSQRNFSHNPELITFKSSYLDLPVFFAFELPELREADLRFLLGFQLSQRINSSQDRLYSSTYDGFTYNLNDFNSFDLGWSFGVSAEYKDFYVRLRSYIGVIKHDVKDQGMMNSFNIDFGYFIFRPLRKR
jgi:hypothetical protein